MKLGNAPELKLIPLGGVGEVTKNMYVYEYGDYQIIVDCGIGFPDESTPGVDFLIPDISYLEKSKKKILGIIVTHGHMDHYGGLPFILPRLPNVPVFGSTMAMAMTEARIREYGLKTRLQVVEKDLKLGPFFIEFIHMTHSTPNAKHLFIKTPTASVYHGADYKIDLNPPDGNPPDLATVARIGKQGVDLFLTDCLGIEKEGSTPSEKLIQNTLDEQVRITKGKFILTTISSSISRIEMAIQAATKYNRRVALVGFSVVKNVEMAQKHGFINIPKGAIIKAEQVKHLPPHQVAIIIAGAQGQVGSGLYKLAAGEHRHIKLKSQDRVVLSSSVIPGSESGVYNLIDTLYQQGVSVAYFGNTKNLHVSGHGYQEDLKLLLNLINPKNVIPIGGDIRHTYLYQEMALKLGYSKTQAIILKDGQTIIISRGQVRQGKPIETKNVYVDGLGVGDVGSTILRDRQAMASDGILLAVIPINSQTNQVTGNIEIISKGFVYMKKSKTLIGKTKDKIIESLRGLEKTKIHDEMFIKKRVEQALEKFLYQQTERRPLIIAVLFKV
ncbi:ribonuclease J [Patescibacteria group bacterium]|nr:ribonuclease J [Patescibacteria group bacterium]MBU1457507.1 ribonuclease J [Patescibacteria group bacterium]